MKFNYTLKGLRKSQEIHFYLEIQNANEYNSYLEKLNLLSSLKIYIYLLQVSM